MMSGNEWNYEDSHNVYFFLNRFHVLDNYSANIILYSGLQFFTNEHFYHWNKFVEIDADLAEKIRRASSPKNAHDLAANNRHMVAASWERRKLKVMKKGLKLKFDQHSDVQKALEKTGKRNLIENASNDLFWGIGSSGLGKNWMGKLWMEIRAQFHP